MTVLPKSTFLDYAGFGISNAATVEAAYGITDAQPFSDPTQGFNMALMLRRRNDPTPLLSSSWATRQQTLKQLRDAGTLWNIYGADPKEFNRISAELKGPSYGFTLLNGSNSNYVSSPESRTLWITIDSAQQFQALFGTPLLYSPSAGLAYWNGPLSLPDDWPIAGLWLDVETAPLASVFTPGATATLPDGPQSPGNAASAAKSPTLFPNIIAADYYNFPLDGQQVQTGPIGLIEPNTGTALPSDDAGTDFAKRLLDYLDKAKATPLSGNVEVLVQGVDGQFSNGADGERSLDTGIVASINPNSPLIFYNGSGETKATGLAQSTTFTVAQSAAWQPVDGLSPAVTTNSFGDTQEMSPGSPFY